jgi:hypothetical protein
MANNKIEIFQHNTKNIACVVIGIADVSGYTPYFTAKSKTSDTLAILTKTGVVTDASGSLAFVLSATDTSIVSGDYVYDITIEKGATIYTVVKDRLSVIDGVKY